MKRFRWRIAAVLSGMVLVTGLLAQSAAVSAVGVGSMDWTGTRWEDPVCDTANELFDVRVFRDSSYGGTQWRFCGSHSNLCASPYGVDSPPAALCLSAGFDGETANDYASSMKVVAVNGGPLCRVRLYQHADYEGGYIQEYDPVWRSSLFPYNDAISSIKRSGTCN